MRLLIVEDSEDDTGLLVLQVRCAGYDLVFQRVETADAMRAALKAEAWDAILCDYQIPGFGALGAMGVAQEDGRDLPFIVVSGTVREETAVELLKAGAHDFIVKDRLARLVPAITREIREAVIRRERKQALEELKLAVKARDEFLSIASHELKTPLTTIELQISSALALVQKGPPDGAVDRLLERLGSKLETADRQVARLASLINNLLDVTRITSGHLQIERRNTDLSTIVKSVVARSRQLLTGRDTPIAVDSAEVVEGCWDPILLETIVTNLVSNAVKFGAGKPIEIILSANPETATLVVRDHGIGIERIDQERIFRRFERAVPDQHFGGFGIGLWIVHQAVDAHDGRIRVSSEPGDGSTFVVELPREKAG